MSAKQWDSVLIDWVNCLKICKPIKHLTELKDGVFFKGILQLLDPGEYTEDSFRTIIQLLQRGYEQIGLQTVNTVQDLTATQLTSIASLLMHYSCIIDHKDVLTSPLCHRLGQRTQTYIRKFLEKMDIHVTDHDLFEIIGECVSKDDVFATRTITSLATNSPLSSRSPLQEFLKTPRIKNERLQEKQREIVRLRSDLDEERFEKIFLQDELHAQQECNAKLKQQMIEKNLLISKLRSDFADLTSAPSTVEQQTDNEIQRRLRAEIKTLEHYTSQLQAEQEVLYQESHSISGKLHKIEAECLSWKEKALINEKDYDKVAEKCDQQEAELKTLRTQCSELTGLLEEIRCKNLNESCMEIDSICDGRSKLMETEELACAVVEVQLKEVQEENGNLKSLLKASEENVLKLNADLVQSETKYREIIEQNRLLEMAQTKLSREFSAINQSYENLRRTQHALAENHESLTSKYNESAYNLQASNEALTNLTQLVEENLNKLADFLRLNPEEIEIGTDKKQGFHHILTSLQRRKEITDSETLALTNRVETLVMQVNKSNQDLVELRENLRENINQRNVVQNQLENERELRDGINKEAEICRRQIVEFEQNLKDLNEILQNELEAKESLQSSLQLKDKENENLKCTIAKLEENVQNMTDKNLNMSNNLEKMNLAMNQLNEKYIKQRDTCTAFEKQLEDSKNILSDKNTEILQQRTLINDFELQLKIKDNELSNFAEEMNKNREIENKNKQLNVDIKKLQEHNENLYKKYLELEENMTDKNLNMSNNLEKMNLAMNQLNEKYIKQRDTCTAFEKQLEDSKNTLSDKNTEILQQRTLINDFELQLKIKDNELSKFAEEMNKNRENENKNKQLNVDIQKLQEHNENLYKKYLELEENMRKTIETLTIKNEEFQQVSQKLIQSKKHSENEIDNFRKEIEQLSNEKLNLNDEIIQLHNKLLITEETNKEFQFKQNANETEILQNKITLNDLTDKYNEIALMNEDLKNEKIENKTQINNLIGDLHNLLEKYNALNEQYAQKVIECNGYQKQIEDDTIQIEAITLEKNSNDRRLQEKNDSLLANINDLQLINEQLNSTISDLQHQLLAKEETVTSSEFDKHKLQHQLEEMRKLHEISIDTHAQQMREIEENLTRAQQRAIDIKTDLIERHEQLERELDVTKSVKCNLEKSLEEEKIIKLEAERELIELKNKYQVLDASHELVNNQIRNIISIFDGVNVNDADEIVQHVQELQQNQLQMAAQIATLENRNGELQQIVDDLQMQNEQIVQDRDVLLDNYTTIHVEIGERDREIDQLKSSNAEQLIQLQQYTERMNAIAESYQQFADSKGQLEQLISERSSLEAAFNDLRQQLCTLNAQMADKINDERESMQIIADDIEKQLAKISKTIYATIFAAIEMPTQLLHSSNGKVDACARLNVDETRETMADCRERISDLSDRLQTFETKMGAKGKVLKENVLKASNHIEGNDELKRKNALLKQKLTLTDSAKVTLERKVKQLREENRALKEVSQNVDNDLHYKNLLHQYVQLKDDHEKLISAHDHQMHTLQSEFDEYRRVQKSNLSPLNSNNNANHVKSEREAKLETDVLKLREAYGNLMSDNGKLDLEIATMRKLLEERTKQFGEMSMVKEVYENLLEENNRLVLELDTVKYKRCRDREDFNKETKSVQDVRNEYEIKLEKMKQKMVEVYKEEGDKQAMKYKSEQRENKQLREVIKQLKEDLEHSNRVKKMAREADKRDSFFLVPAVKKERPSLNSTRSASNLPNVRHQSVQKEDYRAATMPRSIAPINEDFIYRKRRDSISSIGSDLHMEDEGDLFNNKYLADLKDGRCELPSGKESSSSRLSELKWRNSLCPPHLKSSYPAETQFNSPTQFKDEDLKTGAVEFDDSLTTRLLPGEKPPRKKDAGTTSYKKPGPPTPSKNGGRLSLQGNDVHPRDIREQAEKTPKRFTPSRLKSLFTVRNIVKEEKEAGTPTNPNKTKRRSFLWRQK